jgi:hypothetical protein
MHKVKSFAGGLCLSVALFGIGTTNATPVLFGVDSGTDKLLSINTTTGAGTAVGDLGFGNVDGLSFTPSQIPEPTTIAILTIGLLGLGAARRRRNSVGGTRVKGMGA